MLLPIDSFSGVKFRPEQSSNALNRISGDKNKWNWHMLTAATSGLALVPLETK